MTAICFRRRTCAAAWLLGAIAPLVWLSLASAESRTGDAQDDAEVTIVLSGYTAELAGPPIRHERERLTHWHSAESVAAWTVWVDRPCQLEVQVEMAAQAPFAGSPYVVSVGDASFSGAMQDTGAWDRFSVFSLGSAEVAAGEHVVRLQPSELANGVFGNIRSVRLTGKGLRPERNVTPDTSGPIKVFTTAQLRGSGLRECDSLSPLTDAAPNSTTIAVNTSQSFQTIEGFGGAFTESAGIVFAQLSPARQEELLRAYFDGETGHGYTLCRTHINSCDFSVGNYSYDDVEGDVDLEHFSIDHDRERLIPLIKAAQRASQGRGFKLLASPWSPPAWMKTNGEMTGGGKLKPEYRDAWARYYCRYIEEYAREGIEIWGLTVQNEPAAVQRWESCIYTAEEERDFVRDYLGPALHSADLAHVRLIVWDHNRDLLFDRAKTVYDDPEAARYVWGAGFHWYVSDEHHHAQMLTDFYPDKKLLFTEGCLEGTEDVGDWTAGERYARSVINDLNSGACGWIDWNLLLNMDGGPNHVGNYCSAPIMADVERDRLLYNSSYYYLGHFSRFIRPGARRVLSANTGTDLLSTAFRNEDGSVVVVVLNEQEFPVRYTLALDGLLTQTLSPERSITTLVIPAGG